MKTTPKSTQLSILLRCVNRVPASLALVNTGRVHLRRVADVIAYGSVALRRVTIDSYRSGRARNILSRDQDAVQDGFEIKTTSLLYRQTVFTVQNSPVC